MWTRLFNECLDRTGRRLMVVSIALGVLAGFEVSRIVSLTPDFWANTSVWILIGVAFSFVIDLFWVTPFRLWRETDHELAQSKEEIQRLRNVPPAGMRVERIDQQVNIQVQSGASVRIVSASSNTVIVGEDQEGVLVPRGTIFQQGLVAGLGFQGSLSMEMIAGGSEGTSYVPPEVLEKVEQPPPGDVT